MKEANKNKTDKKSSNEPVKKSTGKNKDVDSNQNKGNSNKSVPRHPTTEVNPEG